MKNILLGLFVLLSFQTFSQNNFRGMNWGTPLSELTSKYPDVKWKVETEGKMKSYSTEDFVGGLKVNIHYLFIENKLKIGVYEFMEEHSNNNLYYEDFVYISNILNKKYEMETNEKWNKTTWKNDSNYIGYALLMGDVEIEENYEDEDTSVVHKINSNKMKIEHVLIYRDMDYVKSNRDALLDDF